MPRFVNARTAVCMPLLLSGRGIMIDRALCVVAHTYDATWNSAMGSALNGNSDGEDG